jgi:hypothetical protein
LELWQVGEWWNFFTVCTREEVSFDREKNSQAAMATGDVTELREFDASRLGKVAEIGMFGEQGSGKTRAAQQLVLQNKHRSVCVVSPDTDGTYRALFGTSAVVRDFENKVYRRAEAVIVDHSRTPRAPRIPATRRDSVRILVDRTSEALPSGCWSDMGYLFIGRVSSEAQRALLRYRFSPHNFPEDKWDALLTAVTANPKVPHRFLVVYRHVPDTPLFWWYRAPSPLPEPTPTHSVFQRPTLDPFLPAALVAHVASFLEVDGVVALYRVGPATYNHVARYLARVPSYEQREVRPGNIVLLRSRMPPRYNLDRTA